MPEAQIISVIQVTSGACSFLLVLARRRSPHPLEIFWTQPQQPDLAASGSPPPSCWLILIVAGCHEYTMTHSNLERYYHIKRVHRFKGEEVTKHHTSVLESVSASLCFISLAMAKKTSSTFRFVFALCNRKTCAWWTIPQKRKKKEGRRRRD